MNDLNIQISIIIPTFKTIDSLNAIFDKLFLNKQYIYEIIIIDSSNDNTIADFSCNRFSYGHIWKVSFTEDISSY